MRGFPYTSYFPNGQTLQKTASLGHGNVHVNVDTASNENGETILLVADSAIRAITDVPHSLTLHFDGKSYTYGREDAVARRHVFVQIPPVADVHEGQERMENEGGVAGRIGPATRGVSSLSELKNTAEGWPIGGDRAEDGVVGGGPLNATAGNAITEPLGIC